jgi:hypothetical protein
LAQLLSKLLAAERSYRRRESLLWKPIRSTHFFLPSASMIRRIEAASAASEHQPVDIPEAEIRTGLKGC